jgi:hypothetical protein
LRRGQEDDVAGHRGLEGLRVRATRPRGPADGTTCACESSRSSLGSYEQRWEPPKVPAPRVAETARGGSEATSARPFGGSCDAPPQDGQAMVEIR